MKLIIDIPDSILETIDDDRVISREQLMVLQKHIANGTPITEGDLISRSALKAAVKTKLTSGEYYPYHFIKLIDNAQSISLPITTEGDLISRSKLRKDFVDRYHKAEDWIIKAEDIFIKTRAEATRDFIGEVIMTIDNAPTVETDIEVATKDAYDHGYTDGWKERFGEPDERPKGKWEERYYPCECSNCHKEPLCDDEGYKLSNFCPNCGADMRGKEDGKP